VSCGPVTHARGTIDPVGETVTGTFTRPGRHRLHQGTFTITEQPS